VSSTVTAVVVSYADPLATLGAIDSLRGQSLAPVEVLVVDNDPAGATVSALADHPIFSSVRVLHTGVNLGYTGAANLAARAAVGEWLFFLNPDAVAEHRCLERLLQAIDGADVAIVGAQVLLPDGRVNAGDNPVNIVGLSWSGGYGRPREHGPARDTAAVSGAALLVRRDAFLDVGGLCPAFFMYVDDTDLAWRMRMGGRRVRYCPEAVVVHDYEFRKSSHKWFYLERNRLWALLSNLEMSTLMLLAPLLLAAEAGILTRAISGHWLAEKLQAWSSIFGESRALFRWRRGVQAGRVVSDYRVLRMFSATIETEPIDAGVPHWVNTGLKLYRRVLLGCLRRLEARRAQP
jgi:GT2 family glycosyltransferase